MLNVSFCDKNEVAYELFEYAVIGARYNSQWIYCRHKERQTWEFPGGHREKDENIIETAKRELYEETGAAAFDIQEICAYSIEEDGDISYGMLYFADVRTLGELPPEMEIGELMFMSGIPKNMTYPDVLPYLYARIQTWLNFQTSPDELWDVYDKNRNLTGRTHRRGDLMANGDYHLVVHVWIQKPNGEFLLTKRTPNKGFPNMWECSGGSALAGDDSLTAAMREVEEETGLVVLPENGKCVMSYKRHNSFVDIWLFKQDFDVNAVVFQEGETWDAMCASKDQILQMKEDGLLVPFSYLKGFFEVIEE